jgi:hypothetical protein
MKKYLVFALAGCVAAVSFADKPKLEPYGFLKGDMIYGSNEVAVFGDTTVVSPAIPTGGGQTFLAFTAQHSRVGLKGTAEVDKVTIGGKAEIDFFSNKNDANTKPRLRLAYGWCKVAGLEIAAGQQWDLFSPLNPTTNNTNANMWYTGNYGFRRPQFRIGYTLPLEAVKPAIQVVVAEGAKDAVDVGEDNKAMIPQFQGRLSVGFLEKMAVGVAGLYGTYGANKEPVTWGFGADVNLPIHKLIALKGEFGMGANMNNANIFNIGGSGSAAADVENLGFWFNAISKPVDFFNIVIGLGREQVTSTVVGDALESNLAFYTTLIFPIGQFFSLSLEFEQLVATEADGDTRDASIVDLAGKIVF